MFLANYDMDIARRMVQGVDVWLNTPTRPQEASGTSGMKAAMNGVMQFSVLDGWWVEGYRKGAGWALPMKRTYEDPRYQTNSMRRFSTGPSRRKSFRSITTGGKTAFPTAG